MAFFFDPTAQALTLFRDGPTLSHQAWQRFPDTLSPASSVNYKEERLEDLYAGLNDLTLQAEEIVAQQLQVTQTRLMLETREMFNAYKKFGSMIRLEKGVETFLNAGDSEGMLTFKVIPKQTSKCLVAFGNDEPAHHGNAFRHNDTADDDVSQHSAPFKTPLLTNDLRNLHLLRIIDPNSISYVTTLPWDPLGTTVSWPAGLEWPKGLMGKVNQILSIVDHDCRVRLFHHVCKYGPSPVLRAGIEAQAQSHYSSIFESRAKNYLGLTPETRKFLRHVFEKKSGLNLAESRLLARACRVGQETISLLWEDLAESRKAHMAMKVFITAREIEKGRRLRYREHKEYLQEQKDRIAKERERRKLLQIEQEVKLRHRHMHMGPLGGGMSRGERLH